MGEGRAVERERRAVTGADQPGGAGGQGQPAALVGADAGYGTQLAAVPLDEAGDRAGGERAYRTERAGQRRPPR